MIFPKEKLLNIATTIDLIIDKISEFEQVYQAEINNVHRNYARSARNLVHYLALRSFDLDILQDKLDDIGFPNSPESKTVFCTTCTTLRPL